MMLRPDVVALFSYVQGDSLSRSLSLSLALIHTDTHTHFGLQGGGSQPAELGEHGALDQRDVGALVGPARHERQLVQQRLTPE